MPFARELLLRQEICAVRLDENVLEPIPAGSIFLVNGPSTYVRMIEVVWREKRYIVFQRDLEERTEPALVSEETKALL